MVHKLIMRIACIQIGRKLLLPITGIYLFTGCHFFEWDREPDSIYISINNNTNDSLLLIFGKEEISDSFVLCPNIETVCGNIVFENGDDIIRDLLFTKENCAFEEQTQVYQHDSLLVTWLGPGREMPDSIHHFYNYNSWEILVEADNGKVVQFTITESDYNVNN